MAGNNFTKILLQGYIINNCKRHLFLELGKNKPKLWFDPVRELKPPEHQIFQSKYLTEKGIEYEQLVYSHLKRLPGIMFKEDDENGVINSLLKVKVLQDNYEILMKEPNKSLILLEYQYHIPDNFFLKIFPQKSTFSELPVDYGDQRPDVMILGNEINRFLEKTYEITHDGTVREISLNEHNKRIGISIFDIKHVQDERVGKKHFLEIYYYLITLATFLHENDLDNWYYVLANFNGIIPIRTEHELKSISCVKDVCDKLITQIRWKEAKRIFEEVIVTINELWGIAPCSIEDINLNIHQGCGYCRYFDDCKDTLGMKEGSDPRNWSSKLLPLSSQSIALQLKEEYHCDTIGDVLDNIDSFKIGSTPKPLYSELPTLRMKADALVQQHPVSPRLGQVFSYAIPRYSPIAINIDVEYDQNNDRIFGIGFYLKMFLSSKLTYHRIFDNWWRVWKRALEEDYSVEQIKKKLLLIRDIPLEVITKFRNILRKLNRIRISILGDDNKYGTEIRYYYARINEKIDINGEAFLITHAIKYLDLILTMCNIIEEYVVVDGYNQGTYYGPVTGIFYWSRCQLDHFQEMLERHLKHIIGNPEALKAYNSIMMYLNPTETEVSHPYQHKKLFDVQAFVSSCIGFPDIINYTWHGIASIINPKYHFNPKFWVPHFNFLDLNNWLRYLSKKDSKIGREITKQISIKLIKINDIREHYQKNARQSLSDHSSVIGRSKYSNVYLSHHYHDIAHVWYLFSMLNNALQQQDDEFYRTMFPQFSIGKLFAARVENLTIHHPSQNNNLVRYTFETKGLSSNMKVKEGDVVLLIPNSKRGLRIDSRIHTWKVTLESISWDYSIPGNIITTSLKPRSKCNFDQCLVEGIDPEIEEWYIYPLSFDSWSNKLFSHRNNALLNIEEFGNSWLGFRLAFLWDIRTEPRLVGPSKWIFHTPEVYLYSPSILGMIRDSQWTSLLTKIYPIPDPSQRQAIMISLSNVISGILGPPGTGKSQTIAALIDEFISRRKKGGVPFKILVSSFSYAALRVLIEKVRMSRDTGNNPTLCSQTQIVFIRSETQEAIESKDGCRNIEDLLRTRNNSWKLNGRSRVVTPTHPLEESLEESFIIFANAHQLYYLHERIRDDFAFDLICIDEASQLPTDYVMACLRYIHHHPVVINPPKGKLFTPDAIITTKQEVENLQLGSRLTFHDLTKVVIVGDHNQLPPVRIKNPPKNLGLILDSLFNYYINGHQIPTTQLKVNYRSHPDIVEFTSLLGLYKNLTAHKTKANSVLKGKIDRIKEGWVKEVLSPERVVCSLTHFRKFEIGISEFEAEIVAKIIIGFYDMMDPKNKREERRFWSQRVGVVAPHNAQGKIIIQKVFDHFQVLTQFTHPQLMEFLKSTIYSVEKFQGSDRDLIITTIGLSDKDKINSEEEFIYDLNRFNVLTSRAKHKVIFVSSDEFLRYIPEDRKVLEQASKIYLYVKEFCNMKMTFILKNESKNDELLEFRFKK